MSVEKHNKMVHFWHRYLNYEAGFWSKPNVYRRGLN